MNWVSDRYRSLARRLSTPIPVTTLANPFVGKRLSYLIGANLPMVAPGRVLEVGYDAEGGGDIAYCNLFNEKYDKQSASERTKYGPYLHDSDTAQEYNEGQIDPTGSGWDCNLMDQLTRRQVQRFKCIELDNCDAYSPGNVITAYDRAAAMGFQVIAKNPGICKDGLAMVRHPTVVGIIVEKDCGTPPEMYKLRIAAGKPWLPVWFVCFDKTYAAGLGWRWGHLVFAFITDRQYTNMFVTWSRGGEYVNAIDY